ncbi:FAD/NAD(P)-binding oxidoreductase, partial [Burkholderia pseudomallei]
MTNEILTVDVAIVGAGPAGLAAARAAARSGCTVAIVDDNPRAGGQVWRHGPHAAPGALARASFGVLRQPNVRHLAATRVVAAPRPGALLVEDEQRALVLGYRKLILCCGARELLLPFAGWTLPGVTGAGGLQALVKGGAPVRGERVVIAGSGPLLIASLATARAAGARVVALVEQAPPGAL